jgi:hypothetical protein
VQREVGSYTTCTSGGGCSVQGGTHFQGFTSFELDGPSLASRLREWFIRDFGYTFELHFAVNMNFYGYERYLTNPWETAYWFGKNGDGTLFYPGRPDRIGGTHHIPLESLRLKQIRLGMQDYEYFKILDDLGKQNFVETETGKIIFASDSFEHDVDAFETVRQELATEILGSLGIITVTVSPATISLTTSQSQDFNAVVTGTANQSVTWTLEGTTCPACGTITSGGLYTVPNTAPYDQTVTVKATSQADGTSYGTATVSVNIPPPPEPPTAKEKLGRFGIRNILKALANLFKIKQVDG